MAKATLEYDLSNPEDDDLFTLACQSRSLRNAIWSFDEWLRKQHKYDAGEIDISGEPTPDCGPGVDVPVTDEDRRANAAWSVRQKLTEFLREYEVDID